MVYKNGPQYKARPVDDIKADIDQAAKTYSPNAPALFFPAGNTIAMKTDDLCAICEYARKVFPKLKRITVYGSSQYIHKKGLSGLRRLYEAGLTRIHAGMESGDDEILKEVKKGVITAKQIEAGKWTMQAGIQLSLYVILGLGGKQKTFQHAKKTAQALNAINPDFIRLRTFVPKINTPMLDKVQSGEFEMLSAHGVLQETRTIISSLTVNSILTSDHYTNYINLEGPLPQSRQKFLSQIDTALNLDESCFRPFFVGNQ